MKSPPTGEVAGLNKAVLALRDDTQLGHAEQRLARDSTRLDKDRHARRTDEPVLYGTAEHGSSLCAGPRDDAKVHDFDERFSLVLGEVNRSSRKGSVVCNTYLSVIAVTPSHRRCHNITPGGNDGVNVGIRRGAEETMVSQDPADLAAECPCARNISQKNWAWQKTGANELD